MKNICFREKLNYGNSKKRQKGGGGGNVIHCLLSGLKLKQQTNSGERSFFTDRLTFFTDQRENTTRSPSKMQFFGGTEISPSPPVPTASGNNAHMMYVFNRNGVCLLYREWNRPLKTLSSQQDHKLMFGLLFSLKSLTAKMDPTRCSTLFPLENASLLLHKNWLF